MSEAAGRADGDKGGTEDKGASADGSTPTVDATGATADDTGSGDSGDDPGAGHAVETGRWVGIAGVAIVAIGGGLATTRPGLVLAGAVAVGFATYAGLSTEPTLELELERRLDVETATPGETVAVTLTVENAGDRALADLRLIDGVPAELPVVEGSPRLATALAPGEEATITYAVEARAGRHPFEPATVVAHDPAGSYERTESVEEPDELRALPPRSAGVDLPLRRLTTPQFGRVLTDVGGSGVEFHAVREYRAGDPLKRIDWNRKARTGELATLEFREERAATVAVVVDARAEAYVRADPGQPHAVSRSIGAAAQLTGGLLAAGDRVGLAAFGVADPWLPPAAGDRHHAEVRATLLGHAAFPPTPPTGAFASATRLRLVRKRLSPTTQVVLCSPLVDDTPVEAARELEAHGHLVTVLSPDPTGATSPGERIARLDRTMRISRLRAAGIRVVDWEPGRPLSAALSRAGERWSR